MSAHQTGKMIQVKTSSKINTKLTKKTPPLKMVYQKKLLKMSTWRYQKR